MSVRRRISVNVATAVMAFMLGASTIVFAASSGAIKIEAFNLADGANPSQLARVDANGNVAVSGSVGVTGVVDARPAPPAEPFQMTDADYTSPPGAKAVVTFHVPAGKRAVVQWISVRQSIVAGGTVELQILTLLDGVQSYPFFRTEFQRKDGRFAGQDDWVGHAAVTLYADPGTDIEFISTASDSPLHANVLEVTITGYYLPQ